VRADEVVAYLDANVVEDIERASTGHPRVAVVDAEVVRRLRGALADDRLILPFSDVIAEELTGMIVKAPRRAEELGRFYLGLITTNVAFQVPAPAVTEAVERALLGMPRERVRVVSPEQRSNLRKRLTDPKAYDVEELVAEGRQKIDAWTRTHEEQAQAAHASEKIAQFAPGRPLPELVAAVWPSLSVHWTSPIVESAGKTSRLLERVRAAGKEGELLSVPAVRTGVGYIVGLVCSQALNRKKPDEGDYCDAQHSLSAAAAEAILVTHDSDFARILDSIPGRPLKVMRLSDLVEVVSPRVQGSAVPRH